MVKNGPILANTLYVDNVLSAEDVEFTLPAIEATTADVEAMGTMSFPIWARLEDMEASITKVGLDKGFSRMIDASMKTYEFRFPQETIDEGGNTKIVACKAFVKGIPASVPEIGVVPGEATSSEVTIKVTRYQLFVDGEEVHLVDRLAGILKINGHNYSSGVKNLL